MATRYSHALLVSFVVVLHGVSTLNLFGVGPTGVAWAVVPATLVPAGLAAIFVASRLARATGTPLDLAVGAYLALSLVSGVLFLMPSNPSAIGSYALGVYHFALPMTCYFAARLVQRDRIAWVIEWLVKINTTFLGLTLLLHLIRPSFYETYLATYVLSAEIGADRAVYFARMQGYLGSTAIGTVAASTIALVMALPREKQLRYTLVAVPILGVSALLTFQRGSMAAAFLAIAVLVLRSRIRPSVRLAMPVVLAAAIVFGIARVEDDLGIMGERLRERATSGMVAAVRNFATDRGYAPGWRYAEAFPLGVGLGATSSAADMSGAARWGQVVDANYLRIIADTGVLGLALFLGIVAAAFVAAGKGPLALPLRTFLGVYVLVMVGTNTLDSYYVSHSFWLVLGLMDPRSRPGPGGAGP